MNNRPRMAETILITGSTGVVGSLLAARYRRAKLILLVHRTNPIPGAARNVELVPGDITRARLGLDKKTYDRIARGITGVLHCAGRTDFSITRKEGERVNVEGTARVLELGSDASRLQKLGILSTAYVAGKRRSKIRESDLTHSSGFVNEYEASKYRAEQRAREAMKRLPIAVFRLSTVIGMESGLVKKFGAIHHGLRLFHNGLIPMIPGSPEALVDLITGDYAAAAVHHLFEKFEAGMTYHIVGGTRRSMTLEDFLDLTRQTFAELDPEWRRRDIGAPPLVSLRTYRLLERSAAETQDLFLQKIVSVMSYFAPQLSYPKTFDDDQTRAALARSGIEQPPLETFYKKVLRYAIESEWGGKPSRAARAGA